VPDGKGWNRVDGGKGGEKGGVFDRCGCEVSCVDGAGSETSVIKKDSGGTVAGTIGRGGQIKTGGGFYGILYTYEGAMVCFQGWGGGKEERGRLKRKVPSAAGFKKKRRTCRRKQVCTMNWATCFKVGAGGGKKKCYRLGGLRGHKVGGCRPLLDRGRQKKG